MFYGCSSLGSLDLSSFTTGNVTDMGGMFYGCRSLESLDLSSFTTGNVPDMRSMFLGCSSLGTLDLSSFDFGNISHDCEGMLYGCGALSTLYTPYNVKISVILPAKNNTVWHLPDGTEVTELPQNLSTSVLLTRSPDITTSTEELNMSDVVRVKYVPYSYTIRTDNTDPGNQVTFSVVEGRLAEGLQMYPATGEIYGVPLEAGEFKMTVQASYSDPKYPPAYAELTLIVLDNTDENVGNASDSGYEITQPVPNLNIGGLSGSDTQLLVSEGEYTEFQDAVYLDGRRLQSGIEYTSDAGSTRITIRNQTLADAGTGSHTLSLEFRTQGTGELRRAAQNLVISGMENSEGTGNSGNMDNDADYDGRDEVSVSDPVTVIDYVVQPGDSLWEIAGRFFGNGNYWRRIYQDNVDGIRNPNRLRVGQHLIIYMTVRNGMTGMSAMTWNTSMSVSGNNYIVQPGDNLWRIAGKVYGKNERWREIYEANRNLLSNPERIYAKQVLVIP
ncbi:MAG: LysM peptidoglycan-binding domain-containing protein, partial [Acetatifactor sp.]|nr:LysM peptidoglycan-binding domain-containing protein [Acetatifactor sp.]